MGTNVFTYGTLVTAHITNSPITGADTQYVATGWTGTGSVPVSGGGTNVSFTITNDSTITWQWDTNVFLAVQTDGNGTTDVASTFYPLGTNITITATATNAGYTFTNWTGEVPAIDQTNNPLVLLMDQPHQRPGQLVKIYQSYS